MHFFSLFFGLHPVCSWSVHGSGSADTNAAAKQEVACVMLAQKRACCCHDFFSLLVSCRSLLWVSSIHRHPAVPHALMRSKSAPLWAMPASASTLPYCCWCSCLRLMSSRAPCFLFPLFCLLLRVAPTCLSAPPRSSFAPQTSSFLTHCLFFPFIAFCSAWPPRVCLSPLVLLPQIPTAVRPPGEAQQAGRPPVRHAGGVRAAGQADHRRPRTGNRRPPARLPRQRLRRGMFVCFLACAALLA